MAVESIIGAGVGPKFSLMSSSGPGGEVHNVLLAVGLLRTTDTKIWPKFRECLGGGSHSTLCPCLKYGGRAGE